MPAASGSSTGFQLGRDTSPEASDVVYRCFCKTEEGKTAGQPRKAPISGSTRCDSRATGSPVFIRASVAPAGKKKRQLATGSVQEVAPDRGKCGGVRLSPGPPRDHRCGFHDFRRAAGLPQGGKLEISQGRGPRVEAHVGEFMRAGRRRFVAGTASGCVLWRSISVAGTRLGSTRSSEGEGNVSLRPLGSSTKTALVELGSKCSMLQTAASFASASFRGGSNTDPDGPEQAAEEGFLDHLRTINPDGG
ncbi:hypothetical protein CCHR01_12036 [Colletotrichum chrysophilum]|uniref:Uncharacterized protein n=1 Tax=Colletotrichum chrysophilum TaxID=1836956 RepID=A0AAD9AGU2_9PEZI|nr:hypothetical protein CCHR01_12036 [Colletotrichum chrysophilum]